jgi:hypothetical protein
MPAKAGIQAWPHVLGPWIPAFAGMSASVMLSCQEGESPSDVKS